MKPKNLIIIVALILFSNISIGQIQQQLDSINKSSPFNNNYIKFSPFALIEIEPTLQVGYEYNLTPKIRMQHEIGYMSLFNPAYFIMIDGYPDDIKSNGFKLRSTIKFPLISENPKAKKHHKYLGIDVMFKYLQITEQDVNVRRMDGAYWEMMDITTEKYVGAIHFIYGYNKYLNYSNNIISDWYVGVGLRYKGITDNSPDDANYFPNAPWYDDFDGVFISVMAGMKLGFGI